MKTFFVTYLDTDGDLGHANVEAFDSKDAEIQTRFAYWNVEEIISVEEYESNN